MNQIKSFDTLRKQVDSNSSYIEYSEARLKDVRVPDFTTLKIGENKSHITEKAMRSLFQLIGVPVKFASRLQEVDSSLLQQVSEKLADSAHKEIKVKQYRGDIISIFDSEKRIVEDETFLDIIEQCLNAKSGKDYNIISTEYVPEEGLISIQAQHKDELALDVSYAQHGLHKDSELFKNIIYFRNSSNMKFPATIYSMLMRLACSNLSTIVLPELGGINVSRASERDLKKLPNRVTLTHSNSAIERRLILMANNFLKNAKRRSGFEFLNEQSQRAAKVQASLNEFFGIYNFIMNTLNSCDLEGVDDSERGVAIDRQRIKYSKMLNVNKLEEGYGMTVGKLMQSHPKWLASGTTPISVYDLWNAGTNFSTHLPFIDEDDKVKGIVTSGELISKREFDLEIPRAPKINWEKISLN